MSLPGLQMAINSVSSHGLSSLPMWRERSLAHCPFLIMSLVLSDYNPTLITCLIAQFKESACSTGDPGLIPGLGRSSGEGIGYPLQYSWASLVVQLVKNLPVMRETWVPSLCWKIPWRRERSPTPILWPGEFHGLYSPWGRKESDMAERLSLSLITSFNLNYLLKVSVSKCSHTGG